jgi:hypothetical protein
VTGERLAFDITQAPWGIGHGRQQTDYVRVLTNQLGALLAVLRNGGPANARLPAPSPFRDGKTVEKETG